jgi:MYXO-CTERM domain-containing protein
MNARSHRPAPASPAGAALALLMLALLAAVQAMVIFEHLHEHLHADARAADHHCAVTLFSSGVVDAAPPVVGLPAPEAVPVVLLAAPPPVRVTGEHRLPPGRAPPALA